MSRKVSSKNRDRRDTSGGTTEESQHRGLPPVDFDQIKDHARSKQGAFTPDEIAEETGFDREKVADFFEDDSDFYTATKQDHWRIL